MANGKKHESLSSLQASTEHYKRHNDRVASGAKVAKVVVPIDLYEVPSLARKLHGDELSCTEAMGGPGVMTGAQAVAAMTGAGVPVEQVELTKVIAELEASWLKLDAVLKRCRVLLEKMKGESDG